MREGEKAGGRNRGRKREKVGGGGKERGKG